MGDMNRAMKLTISTQSLRKFFCSTFAFNWELFMKNFQLNSSLNVDEKQNERLSNLHCMYVNKRPIMLPNRYFCKQLILTGKC